MLFNQIKELEQELADVEEKRVEYEELIEEESQSQGRNMQLEEYQVLYIGAASPFQYFLKSVCFL